MACELFKHPPFTAALTAAQIPPDANAYAKAFLKQCLDTQAPLGTFVREVHNGQRLVKFYEHHTICNGSPGCCPGVTLLADTSPPGAVPDNGVSPAAIDWPVVLATGAAAVGVVGLFILAVKHAGRAGRRRR